MVTPMPQLRSAWNKSHKLRSLLTFAINERERVRVMDIEFEGNQIFSDKKLRSQMKLVQQSGLITRFQSKDILHREKLEFDLRKVDNYMRSKGYLQARHGEARIEGIGKRRTGFPILPCRFSPQSTKACASRCPSRGQDISPGRSED